MWSNRRFRRRSVEPEATLRSYRAEPRQEFVKSLAQRVATEGSVRRRTAWSRLAFAGAASTMILGMFASFGGLGYAASGATSTYTAVKNIVVDQKLNVDVRESSASAQYDTEPAPPPQQNVAPASETKGAAAAAIGEADTLPFTGISLLATVLIGCMLLALGLILRRRERSDS
jgi:hypothetical protein